MAESGTAAAGYGSAGTVASVQRNAARFAKSQYIEWRCRRGQRETKLAGLQNLPANFFDRFGGGPGPLCPPVGCATGGTVADVRFYHDLKYYNIFQISYLLDFSSI